MVFGQHRVPSHPPSQPRHSELSPREMPQGRTSFPDRQTHYPVFKPQIAHLSALGRAASEARRLPGVEAGPHFQTGSAQAHAAEVMISYGRKLNPRTQYRLHRNEQINNSVTLSEKFPRLKTLRVTVDYLDSTGTTRSGRMKYK